MEPADSQWAGGKQLKTHEQIVIFDGEAGNPADLLTDAYRSRMS